MRASLAAGCNFWNVAIFYGTPEYNSMHLLERYFTKYPEDADKVVLSVKAGLNPQTFKPDGSVERTRNSITYCQKVLNGRKSIDILEMARVDRDTPLETTYKGLEECVKEGLIGGIGVSEMSAATLRKVAKITKIECCEVEISLWSTGIFTNGTAAACAENNIVVVGYSPIGRGILSGAIKSPEDIPAGDMRKTMPRFQPGAFEENLKLVAEVQKVAKEKGCTPAQLAISWVKHQSKLNGNPEIIPIPGASTAKRVQENSTDVSLSADELAKIQSILAKCEVVGGRYGGPGALYIEG
ncbi:MAG: Pyridoxine 4-dehydrogenase [Claussenomyces sp. TS43310]|nr:MAG: Pyridoxine 4-dehydrogenase [Claussenomyces sp. TS43310]